MSVSDENFVPCLGELFFEIQIVFDDAVVYNDHIAGAMGVGVGFRRPAMSRPPCVADPDGSRYRVAGEDEFRDF